MVQSVATLASLLIAAGALALIAGVLADDWNAVLHALRGRTLFALKPIPLCSRGSSDRRAHVVRVSSQSAPQRAAA